MKQYQLVIKAHNRNGILERILRTVRFRGGCIISMQMNQIDNNDLDLSLHLRNLDKNVVLLKHLSKINDVFSINMI
ncbi:ACT domain-containing protein [Orbaceae bacterium ac157xtp]